MGVGLMRDILNTLTALLKYNELKWRILMMNCNQGMNPCFRCQDMDVWNTTYPHEVKAF